MKRPGDRKMKEKNEWKKINKTTQTKIYKITASLSLVEH